MNKKTFIFFMTAIAIFGLASCLSTQGSNQNSKTSLDWAGVYTGTIPSASGSGINVRLKLSQDQSYELRYEYLDKPDNSFTFKGTFKWDDTGNIVILEIADAPSHYKVVKNKLIQMDMEGKPIKGRLANNYVLKKTG